MKFITSKEVIKIHDKSIERFGGSNGIRDAGLLDSAVSQPRMHVFGVYVHEDVYQMAAAYCFHIIKNHAFVDGNKRTGILTAIMFLEKNGIAVSDNFADLRSSSRRLSTPSGLGKLWRTETDRSLGVSESSNMRRFEQLYNFAIDVAASRYTKDEIAQFFKKIMF